jgi:hypothetical protein
MALAEQNANPSGPAPAVLVRTGDEPISRQEADAAYHRTRIYLLFSAGWFLLIAAVMAVIGAAGWQLYLGAVAMLEGVAMPLFLRYHRRDLDQRVRAGEEALGAQ